MTRESILESIITIVRRELNNESLTFTEDMIATDIEGWDSLTHMSIITATETFFGVSFSFMEVVNLDKIGDLVSLVLEKI